MITSLSQRDARRLALHAQGLLRAGAFGRGKGAVDRAIAHLGYVQIDTISVVERAHHHVLMTRVPNYTPRMLDRLQVPERKVFEYWFHAAAYLPMADYRYYLPTMEYFRGKLPRSRPGRKLEREVTARIRAEGPLQSKDFEAPPGHRSAGWWAHKPAKAALERLFLYGELMVSRREQFQKVYDLRERVLPDGTDVSTPDATERDHFLIHRVLASHGVASVGDVGRSRPTWTGGSTQRSLARTLAELVEAGKIEEVEVEGRRYFTTREHLERLPLRFGRLRATILSPFDNVIIQRPRLNALFGFDYTIECYVPAAKRKYGYFALPVLYGDRLVARMDCKAQREHARLDVRQLSFEEPVRDAEPLLAALAEATRDFARANGCREVRIDRVIPNGFSAPLRRLVGA